MDVLFDTNVVMNFITGREDKFSESSTEAVVRCSKGYFRGYVAFHSLSTLWYVLRKEMPDYRVRDNLLNVCKVLRVTGAPHWRVVQAIKNNDFKDFEDCLQDECAKSVNAQLIVTCNVRDYTCAGTTAVTPDQFLDILDGAT